MTEPLFPQDSLSKAQYTALFDWAFADFVASLKDPPQSAMAWLDALNNEVFIGHLITLCQERLPGTPLPLPKDGTSMDFQRAVENTARNYLTVILGYAWETILNETGVEKE